MIETLFWIALAFVGGVLTGLLWAERRINGD